MKCFKQVTFITVLILSLGLTRFSGSVSLRHAREHLKSYNFSSIEVPDSNGQLGFTTLIAINDKGEITGGFVAADPEGFLIDRRSEISRIACPAATFTAIRGINNSGAMAGDCDNHAFFRDRWGQFTFIEAPDSKATTGRGLNDSNQVLGYYEDKAGDQHGFVWDDGTFFSFDLPDLENVIPYPLGINNQGQIVGHYTDSACNCNGGGFLLSRGILTRIDFPGAIATIPVGINDHAQIVGFYIDSAEQHHGFSFDHGDFFTVDVPDVEFTEAYGINNRGQIVGRYLRTDSIYNIGFIADPRNPV